MYFTLFQFPRSPGTPIQSFLGAVSVFFEFILGSHSDESLSCRFNRFPSQFLSCLDDRITDNIFFPIGLSLYFSIWLIVVLFRSFIPFTLLGPWFSFIPCCMLEMEPVNHNSYFGPLYASNFRIRQDSCC